MEDLESKLGAVLNNPEMMGKIMALAQNLNQSSGQSTQEAVPAGPGNMDLSMVQKLSGLAKQSGIDRNQQSLLRALNPYLSRQRIQKLERAMRAAKMASMAGLLAKQVK